MINDASIPSNKTQDVKQIYLVNNNNPNAIYSTDPSRFERFETPEHYLKRTERKALTCYTNCLVDHPCFFCLIVFIIFAFSMVVDAFLYGMADADVSQLYPEGNRYTNALRSRIAAQESLVDYFGKSTPEGIRPQSQRHDFNWYIIVIAELDDKSNNASIFDDPSHFRTMYDFEDRFLNHAGYDDLCWIDAAQNPEVPLNHAGCLQFSITSIMRIYLDLFGAVFGYFPGSSSSIWYPLFEANEMNAINGGNSTGIMTVNEFIPFLLMLSPGAADLLGPWKQDVLTALDTGEYQWYCPFHQSFLYLASPVPTEGIYDDDGVLIGKRSKFNSHFDDKQKQTEDHLIGNMLQEMWDDLVVEHNAEYVENGVNLYFHQMSVWYKSIADLITTEATYLFGCTFFVVFIYVTYTVGSLFLSFVCTLQMLITFLIGFAAYEGVFQITRFDSLCMGVVFVLMAVGVYYCVFHSAPRGNPFLENPSKRKIIRKSF